MIDLDLAPYRGSVRFGSWGWSTIVERLLNYSYTDYQITDRMADLAVQFYRNIDCDTIVLDRECGGKVLKERYIQKAEILVGMTRDNPTFQRALLKVPYAVSCPNLWDVIDHDHPGLFLPLRRVVSSRLVTVKHLEWADVSGFRFHKLDGDMWINLKERTIHWECMPAMYPYHRDLIEYVSKQIDRHFFSDSFGGVIVTPEGRKHYGDGKEVVYGCMSDSGYISGWGANCSVYFREPETKGDFRELSVVGTDCPNCDEGSLFKSATHWKCASRCGYKEYRVIEDSNIVLHDSYVLRKLAS